MTRQRYRASSTLSSKLLAGCTAGLLLVASFPVAGTEPDGHHPPLPDAHQPPLDFAFKGPVEIPSNDLVLCTGPCSSAPPVISATLDPGLSYKEDFSVGLGQTGPVLFELTGSRLRMELAF